MEKDFEYKSYRIMNDRKYMKSHEWVKELENNVWVIGITDYAQKLLREITYVQFEEVDTDFSQKSVISTVEAIKASGDIYAPFDLKLIEVNEVLEDEPEKINDDPYGEGWLVKFSATNFDTSLIIKPEEYKMVIKSELDEL